jgi:hypothetical protein
MIHYINIKLQQIAVHKVGNKINDEKVELSDELIDLDDDKLVRLFLKYFLSSFSGDEMARLHHDFEIDLNEVYSLAKQIFAAPSELLQHSKNIAQHLHNCTVHPKIKDGELYVAYFTDIILDDVVTNAIGIFKSETKDNFLKVDIKNQKALIEYGEGVNTNTLDKGCLIFETDEAEGYRVCIIDNLNKGKEAVYWKDDFLNIRTIHDEFHQTRDFLSIAKEFITKNLPDEIDASKADKIDLLNRSMDYFKENQIFDKQLFEKKVFDDSVIIDSFKKFDEEYRQQNELELPDNFEISAPAVKKQSRIFKNVLKLDKNFHIYIHGNKELIEHGVDEKGRKFYKIYYNEEF